jgi:hypothetical protein
MKFSRKFGVSCLVAMSLPLLVVPLTHSDGKKTSAKQTTAKTDQTKK